MSACHLNTLDIHVCNQGPCILDNFLKLEYKENMLMNAMNTSGGHSKYRED